MSAFLPISQMSKKMRGCITMKKKTFFTAIMIVLMLVLSACAENNGYSSDKVGDIQTEGTTLPVEDRVGNAITVPENIETIVSLAPSITQVLEDLGVIEKLIAVDNQSPFHVEGLTELPQVDIVSPDIETLLALEPDIIFASEISFGQDEDIFQMLIDAGICVVQIPTSNSIAAIKEDNQFIADCLQLSEKGEALNSEMQAVIEEIATIGASITEQKTVFFEISPLPDIVSFGTGVFLNEMLEIIGAKNVLADQEGWLPVNEEAAVDTNPDVILTNVNFIENPVEEILSRSGWQNVTAVETEAVYSIDNASSSLPNHRIVEALKQMAIAVYPKEFATLNE